MLTDSQILARLRTALLVIVAGMCVGTVAELLLMEHTESRSQLIPFVLCALGLAATLLAMLRPQRLPLLALRAVMGLLVIGSAFGVYKHLEHNLELEHELNHGAPLSSLIIPALQGASPMLAPGILALAALLALAATYGHPALRRGA